MEQGRWNDCRGRLKVDMDAWWTEQMNGGIGKGEDAHKEVG